MWMTPNLNLRSAISVAISTSLQRSGQSKRKLSKPVSLRFRAARHLRFRAIAAHHVDKHRRLLHRLNLGLKHDGRWPADSAVLPDTPEMYGHENRGDQRYAYAVPDLIAQ